MKNISLLLAGLMASGLASAVEFGSSGLLTQTDCNNLNENVSINLTTGVVAGVDCTAGRVAIAACHTSGMLKSRQMPRKTVQEPDTDPNAAPGATVDVQVACTIGDADPDCAPTPVSGAAIASASTTRGTVNSIYPGTGECTATGADTAAGTLN